MTVTLETCENTTPSAVIDRISLVLDAFDGPGRLTLAGASSNPSPRGTHEQDQCPPVERHDPP